VGEDARQIEQEIEGTRADLGRNLDELEDRARELADWRTHYRKHSNVFIGAAFATGFALGLATIPRSDRVPRSRPSGRYEPLETHRPRFAAVARSADRAKHQFSNTWDQIADALLGLASAKAVQIVGDFVPGLRDHLRPGDGPDINRTFPSTTH
jgi:hypothetical protein